MATPGEKLAESLEVLHNLQKKGFVGIQSSDLSRVHRKRLADNGFIREVTRGWYIATPQEESNGDSTSWYISYWDFCAQYLKERYGEDYYISAEQSIKLHTGNTTVPKQLIVRSPKGNNRSTEFLFETSLFVMKSALPNREEIEEIDSLKILSLPSSIVHCSSSCFQDNSVDMRTALLMIKDSSDLLKILLEGGHSVVAGRLMGAFKNIGQEKLSNDIGKTMKSAGYVIRESDPFQNPTPVDFHNRPFAPHANRIKLLWREMRGLVIQYFPVEPGIPKDKRGYLRKIEELFTTDAYHSLSIEKYVVTPALIEQVRSGKWDLDGNENDKNQRDAMAARGYWQAFQVVEKSILKILEGENPGAVVDSDHGDWYRELFSPSVTAGILQPSDLAGYRTGQVFIGQSKHVPMPKEAVRDVMPILFELLEQEENAAVRAVLGHFFFVYTHPYMDGNGRMGRFLMNSMLASGGYPWTVIPVQERETYMRSLESASVEQDIRPFAQFLAWLVKETMDGNPLARNG